MDSELLAIERQHLWHPFTPQQAWTDDSHRPLNLVSGAGCWLTDDSGQRYIDGNASIWTNVHGHAHPTINAAIKAQLDKVAHTSFLGFTHEPAIRLAATLVGLFPGRELSRVFYSDNGSTAVEAGLRMALHYWRQEGQPQRDTILAFDRAYHGDTLGAASLGGLPIFKGAATDFGYRVITIGDIATLAEMDASRIAAVIIEPLVQGAAGIRLWPTGMLRQLRHWCDTTGVLMMLDEVMTGFGRTGQMFACQCEDVVPDILAVAKGLTGGYLPMAATMVREHLYASFLAPENTFYYGHSYTASQLGCAAALGSLRVFADEQTLAQMPSKVAALELLLQDLGHHPLVAEVRQCGLIAGIELRGQRLIGPAVCVAARRYGLLTRPVLNTIVLMPPLAINITEISQMGNALKCALDDVQKEAPDAV
jgi:adenosylmethionine---8-amino-7-oxononanoate aminotransferase